MQEAERECDNPGVSFRQTRVASPAVNDLRCDERDAQRDDRLDGRPRYVNEAQRGAGQREAMREREGSDGDDGPPRALHQKQKCENEQEMINTDAGCARRRAASRSARRRGGSAELER